MTDLTPIIPPATRHDGWTAARVAQFLDHLANDGSIRAACGRVGMSREAAYRLRRRDELFARAWNAALVLAREASAEVLESRAIHGVEEQIWFRGELVGTRRKYDSRLLLAHMARLDRIADEERASEDAARFDELLALLGGEPVPEALASDCDALPLARDEAIEIARVAAVSDWEDTPKRERVGGCYDAADRAEVETAVACDQWLAGARGAVDRLLEAPAAEPCTVSELSTSDQDGAEPEKAQGDVIVAQPVPPSAGDTAEALATGEPTKQEREPRYADFARSPTSWRDYCEARKSFHQRMLAERAAKR